MIFLLASLLQQPAVQNFPNADRPGAHLAAVSAQLVHLCHGTDEGADRKTLLRRELDAANVVEFAKAPSARDWTALGCDRVLLFVDGAIAHSGPLMVPGDSWDHGAEHAFIEALKTAPGDPTASAGLAILAMNEDEPKPLATIVADLVYAAGHGVASAAVIRACGELAFRVDSAIASRNCALKGLSLGLDSTWNLLRLARLAFRGADTVGGSNYFDLAAQTAHDSVTREEIDWHLQWFLSPAERKEWAALPEWQRGKWVVDRLASRDVRDGQPPGARLAEHFKRLEYVEKNFRLQVARVMHGAMMSGPVVGGDASLDTTSFSHDTTVFRDYKRWQADFDDRGVIWMRWGKPSKIAIDTGLVARETWRYDIDGKIMMVTFQHEDFSGAGGATTLRTGLVGEYMCGLDSWRCGLAMRVASAEAAAAAAAAGYVKPMGTTTTQLPPEVRQQVINDDRLMIGEATTKDDNSVRGEKPIEVIADLHRLWDPLSAQPEALVTWAVKASDLVTPRGDSSRTALIDFQLRSWDAAALGWWDTTFTKHLLLPDTTLKNVHLTGFLVTASPPGVSSWSLVASQPSNRRGRTWDTSSPPLDSGAIALSDLVLGQTGQGIVWNNHNTAIDLAPLNAVDRIRPVSLYYQIRSDTERRGLHITVALYRIDNGVTADSAALAVTFDQDLQDGINEIAPTLDVSRLDKGSYAVEVRVADASER
ncbi:MAG: hypothetical protein ACREL5_11085, partial [Gemmatimonadales bacterium]